MSITFLSLASRPGVAGPHRAPPVTQLARIHAKVRDASRAWRERARERREARLAAEALAHLGPRELRDIGLVRLGGVTSARYLRIHDFG